MLLNIKSRQLNNKVKVWIEKYKSTDLEALKLDKAAEEVEKEVADKFNFK